MGAVNKANGRQSGRNKVYYAQQYTTTYGNKKRAINKHIAKLERALMMHANDEGFDNEKRVRIEKQIMDCERAIRDLPTRK